ncbi:hypothetical protein RND71_034275 [Anisodus tanguticus]|uniref:mannose-6-phosphate isomerase n=1 Tax=Anisodus tanguticus TaxID=243964 RepID=A0AAE1V2E0_9SOLA|nr:hypothetical protein RND71_034275 [Anisodus tanguticus]
MLMIGLHSLEVEELKLIVQTVPEIVEVVGTTHAEQVLELNEDDGKEKGKLVLQSVFTELMSASKDVVAEVIAKLINRLHIKNQARELTEKEQVVLRLEKQYPADGYPEILQGTAVNPHIMRYIPPFDEFEVDRCILPEESTA